MILPGSYANGFAPRDGSPLYPELWRNCVGAWAPCLGSTGSRLRDWSGFGRHGTLTNMAVATCWSRSSSRYSLDFDNTNDYVDCGGASSVLNFTTGGRFTLSAWFYTRLVSDYQVFFSKLTGSTGYMFGLFNSRVFGQADAAFNATGATPVVNTWNHICTTWNGSVVETWLNAENADSAAATTLTGTAASGWIGGVVTAATAPMNGLLDDIRVYDRVLMHKEIKMLAARRGIAYELAPRRRSSAAVAAAFNRRRRLLLGASS